MSGFGTQPFTPNGALSVQGEPTLDSVDQYGKVTNLNQIPDYKNIKAVAQALQAEGLTNLGQYPTTVTSASATTLSAANLLGGCILRSGPTAAYGDTFDNADNIVNAYPNAVIGSSFWLVISNTVAFANTLVAGTGVTLLGTTAIAASSSRLFLVRITNVVAPAVTITGILSGSN